MIRIILTEQNFKDLTAGKIVKITEGEDHVEIALEVIAYDRMCDIVFDNYEKYYKSGFIPINE
jgi:hypothetical protein